jgi:type VI secretion system secreted protein Hcp
MPRDHIGGIMASDVYLQIDGIKGESSDSAHQGWIECQSVNWSLHQPKSATGSTAGGHTAERSELSDVSLQKIADLASPILAQHCAMGKTIPKAKLEFMRADGNGTRIKYYEVELENVLVAHVAQGVNGGGAGGSTVGGWDLAANKVA